MPATVPLLSFDGRGALDLLLEVVARTGTGVQFELIEAPDTEAAARALAAAPAAFSLAEVDGPQLLGALGARLWRTLGPPHPGLAPGAGGAAERGRDAADTLPAVFSMPCPGLALERGSEGARTLLAGPGLSALGFEVPRDAALTLEVVSTAEATAVVSAAFEHARRSGLGGVTVVHTKSLLPATEGIFLHAARNVAVRFEGMVYRDLTLEDFARAALRDRKAFEVVVGTPAAAAAALELLAAVAGVPRPTTVVECGEPGSGALLFGRHGDGGGQAGMLRSAAALLAHLGELEGAERLWRALRDGALHERFERRPGEVVCELLAR